MVHRAQVTFALQWMAHRLMNGDSGWKIQTWKSRQIFVGPTVPGRFISGIRMETALNLPNRGFGRFHERYSHPQRPGY